jgi:hypothetical protein
VNATELGTCTRGCPAPAEVPWSRERLCWDCVDRELDLLALALRNDENRAAYIKAP